tara:strand:- start:457 stop:747 length:291 start_codon:yes stop_codon:yes gene_type:complete
MEVLIETLLVNLSLIACVAVALAIAIKSTSKYKNLFITGLVVLLLANLLAIPLTVFWQNLFSGKIALYIICNLIGVFSGIGVIILAKAFNAVQKRV